MKIPIKINGKSYKIPMICDLSTKEFIEMTKVEGIFSESGTFDCPKYIAWYLKLNIKDTFFVTMPNKLHRELSYFPDIQNDPLPKLDYIDKNKIIQTVGQRFQVEESSLKGYDLAVFVLAVAQSGSNNIDEVNALYDDYRSKPAVHILPHAFFFFEIYKSGKNKGAGFSRLLRGLTKISRLRNKQEANV